MGRRKLPVPALTQFSQLDINPEELNDLIERNGVSGELRTAIKCPCFRIEMQAPGSNCGICRGTGYTYPESMYQCAIAMMTGRKAQREDQAAGQNKRALSVSATFVTGFWPSPGDLWLPDEELHTVQEVLHRNMKQVDEKVAAGRQEADVPQMQPPRVIQVRRERLLYPKVECIEAVYWIKEGRSRADDKLIEARENTSWVFDFADSRLVWHDGKGPPAGQAFTIRYRAPAAYIVEYDPSTFRQQAGNVMPMQTTMARLDRWGDKSLRGTEPERPRWR